MTTCSSDGEGCLFMTVVFACECGRTVRMLSYINQHAMCACRRRWQIVQDQAGRVRMDMRGPIPWPEPERVRNVHTGGSEAESHATNRAGLHAVGI